MDVERIADAFRSIGPWLGGRGAIKALSLSFAAGVGSVALGCVPEATVSLRGVPLPWLRILVILGLPVLGSVAWLLVTQLYLRSGSGTKIGLAYDGDIVRVSDWRRSCDVLSELCRNGAVRRRVTLRFIPPRVAMEEETATKFMARYGFTLLTVARYSKRIRPDTEDEGKETRSFQYSLRVATEEERKAFVEKTLHVATAILAAQKSPRTLLELLDTHAHRLRDMLLLLVPDQATF